MDGDAENSPSDSIRVYTDLHFYNARVKNKEHYFESMKRPQLLASLVLSLTLTCHAHTWTFAPLRDQNGDFFSSGGGIELVLDLTFSTTLDKYLMALKTKDGSLVILGSSDGQRWTTLASETWTWGHNTGTLLANGEALMLMIGNGIFRWPYSGWLRSRNSSFGGLTSISGSGSRVAVSGPYYSNDWGVSFRKGFSSTSVGFFATADGSFWGTNGTAALLESADGSLFTVVSSLPSGLSSMYGVVGIGSRLVFVSQSFAPDNKKRFTIHSKLRNQDYSLHGFFNLTPSVQPWAMKSSSSSRGAIFALPNLGIIEILASDSDLVINSLEDVQFKVDWRGVAIGTGESILVSASGVVATAPLDLSAPNSDLDEDGVSDQYETGTGIFVSPSDTGTSPIKMDSDGDGFTDGFEILSGSNPNSQSSTPSDNLSWLRLSVEFSFVAKLDQKFSVQKSSDMIKWTTVETGIQGNGSIISRLYKTDGEQKQFYRAVAE